MQTANPTRRFEVAREIVAMKVEALSLPRGEATDFARKLANAKAPSKKLTNGVGIVQDLLRCLQKQRLEATRRQQSSHRGKRARHPADS
jgi:hypothetical protein